MNVSNQYLSGRFALVNGKNMAQKYYVVWSGKKTGVFTSWDEVKRLIQGFPGAKYKSFPTKEIAEINVPVRHFSDDSLTVRGEFNEIAINPVIDSINISSLNLNEGSVVTFNIAGTDFADGQQIYYEIVSSEDYQVAASQTSYNFTNINSSADISFNITYFNVAPGT